MQKAEAKASERRSKAAMNAKQAEVRKTLEKNAGDELMSNKKRSQREVLVAVGSRGMTG